MIKRDNKQRTKLSIGEAVSIIDRFNDGCLASNNLKGSGDKVFFTFDGIEIKEEMLVFKQHTGIDTVSFSVADVTEDIYLVEDNQTSHRYVEFMLMDGEIWLAQPYSDSTRRPRPREVHQEIDVDVFLDRLEKSEKVLVTQMRTQITTNSSFDTINIQDTNDDYDWFGDREIKVTLADSFDTRINCTLDIDGYDTKYYMAADHAFGCIVYIDLRDTPFTIIGIFMSYPERE